ncbi:MAG: hypothetical protein HC833_21645 [Leptolyngbyaceae cyanobacterium RM1_406_9]|nr:hypothetical protein [Leptolyngbyaceae cyanobacterium RM1_406_9]
MLLIHLAQDITTGLTSVAAWSEVWHSYWPSPMDWSLLAQQFETDVFADFRSAFNNFIESGQVWALLIGLILGYLIRSLTSYG